MKLCVRMRRVRVKLACSGGSQLELSTAGVVREQTAVVGLRLTVRERAAASSARAVLDLVTLL